MSPLTEIDPRQLRPIMHAEIDRLEGEDLAVLHRVALQLELERTSARLDAAFDEDRVQGRLERVPEIIREARAALRARAGK